MSTIPAHRGEGRHAVHGEDHVGQRHGETVQTRGHPEIIHEFDQAHRQQGQVAFAGDEAPVEKPCFPGSQRKASAEAT